MYTLGTGLLLEAVDTKQLFPPLDKQFSIFITVHYTPVAPRSIKTKLLLGVYARTRACCSTERRSNYICNALKVAGLPRTAPERGTAARAPGAAHAGPPRCPQAPSSPVNPTPHVAGAHRATGKGLGAAGARHLPWGLTAQ